MPITERHFRPTMIWADIVGANMSNDTWAIVNRHLHGADLRGSGLTLAGGAERPAEPTLRTLMATRKIAMSREQVDALNLDEVRQDHLARVLHHMSVAMRMPLGEARLRSGGYSPRGWTVRNEIEQYLHDVAMNKASIPMRMVGAPSRPAE
jgi:hypothetical protein